jgi:hypothetical protein
MKNPSCFSYFAVLTAFILYCTSANSQITGTSGSLSVNPSVATIVDPAVTVGGIANFTNATVQITGNFYAGDLLSFDATVANSFGITGSYVTTAVSGILTFTGTTSPANWQSIFRTVKYQNTTASCGPSSRTIIFIQGKYLYNSYNGHFYEYVPTPLTWLNAKAAAEAKTFNGMQGYLATSTSAGENNFIWKLISADVWIGASYDYQLINAATGTTTFSDQASAISNVYWVTGPEKGTYVSSGLVNPVAQGGQYMNWNGGEPNNFGNEFYIELYSGTAGKWNDLGAGSNLPYIVEYGGMPGDVPQNNDFSRSLSLTSTVGGEITGGDVSVCSGSNSVTLTSTAAVSGVSIVRWESSLDNFLTGGTVINNTTNTLTVTNLTQTTYYRTVANGNSCSNAPSSSTKITVGSTAPGSLGAAQSVICDNSSAQLTLSAYSGDILRWQTSTDNSTWSDIANTNPTYTTAPLAIGTYYYRVEVKSAACSGSIFSGSKMISVLPISSSVAGTISGNNTACGSGNSGTLTLSGNTGNVVKWQFSTDNGNTWNDINNTATTYNFNSISSNTKYRVQVQNGPCAPIVTSPDFTVYYSPDHTGIWIGAISTDYGTAGNWRCGVPADGDNIVISTSVPYMPVADQDRIVGNITFENNTTIDVNGHTITLQGIVSGTNSGRFIGSSASSVVANGDGDVGTIYFDQSNPGTGNHLNNFTINRNKIVVPTPATTPVCTPSDYGGGWGIYLTNVSLGTINNSPWSDNGYNNYFDSYSTSVDPGNSYTLSLATSYDYWSDEGIKIWIDWNNNGIFGDDPNEIITDNYHAYPGGSYDFTINAPALGGAITGGTKTMRIFVDDYWNMMYDGLDACNGELGEFEDYKINLLPLPLSNGQVTLGNDLSIGGLLTFTNGNIITGSNLLIMNAGSSVAGAGNDSHVNGIVRKIGNTAFTFPVGDDTYYAPISMSAPADINDHFTASYTRADPLSVYNNTNYGSGLIGIGSNEYWILNRTGGSSSVAVTLSWDNARSTAITDPGFLRVARWNGTMWSNEGNANLTTGSLSAGTVTSGIVNNFSPFTFGFSSILLPVNLLEFDAVKANREVNLRWQTSGEINTARFEIERTGDGITWMKIGTVNAHGGSNVTGYNFTDRSPATGNNFYRLRQVDNDGKFSYSPVRLINFDALQNISVYPNPFGNIVTINTGNRPIGIVTVVDITGKTVYHAKIDKTVETLNLAQLSAGTYTIINNGNIFKIIKLK